MIDPGKASEQAQCRSALAKSHRTTQHLPSERLDSQAAAAFCVGEGSSREAVWKEVKALPLFGHRNGVVLQLVWHPRETEAARRTDPLSKRDDRHDLRSRHAPLRQQLNGSRWPGLQSRRACRWLRHRCHQLGAQLSAFARKLQYLHTPHFFTCSHSLQSRLQNEPDAGKSAELGSVLAYAHVLGNRCHHGDRNTLQCATTTAKNN